MNVNENNMLNEDWHAQINHLVQKTTLEELKSWINDGKLQPNHKVKVRNLSWIEAQKVPAFQKLFESRKKNAPAQPEQSQSATLPLNIPAPTFTEVSVKSQNAAIPPLSFPSETKSDAPTETKPEIAEPSIPFQIYEKKALAKTRQAEQTEQAEQNTKPLKKKTNKPLIFKPKNNLSLLKSVLIFLAGCGLMFLLAWGGAYLWVFQIRGTVKVDEKNISELVILESNLATDKVGLRLKIAALEQATATSGTEDNSIPKLDLSQEMAKLDKGFDVQRKVIVENHQATLLTNDFDNTFYSSFAVLMILFLLARIFYGKTNQTVKNDYSAGSTTLSSADSLNFQTTINQSVKTENSSNIHITKTSETHLTMSPNSHITTPPDANSLTFSENGERIVYVQSPNSPRPSEPDKAVKCLLHRDKPAKFVCEDCSNHFCEECPQIINTIENNCPFCKVVCKSIASKDGDVESEATGMNSNFTVFDYPDEKIQKIGVFTAFLIALFLSGPIAYFWVYEIAPRLEKREAEVVQNTNSSEKGNGNSNVNPAANKTIEAGNNVSSESAAANQPCIDPQTKKPFECDEETRRTLYEHTRKTQSVESAQKQVSEKTTTVMSGIVPTDNSTQENQPTTQEKQNPVEEARKENDKRLFFQIFIGSFLFLFGSLLSTRLFGDKETNQVNPE